MPLRSALGYGLLPLQGEHVIFIAILSSVYTYKGEEAQLPLLFLLRHDVLRLSKMLHYQYHDLWSQLPAPLLPTQPSEGRLKAMVVPYPIPQLAPSGGTVTRGKYSIDI